MQLVTSHKQKSKCFSLNSRNSPGCAPRKTLQTSLGFRGHSITNFPHIMVLLTINFVCVCCLCVNYQKRHKHQNRWTCWWVKPKNTTFKTVQLLFYLSAWGFWKLYRERQKLTAHTASCINGKRKGSKCFHVEQLSEFFITYILSNAFEEQFCRFNCHSSCRLVLSVVLKQDEHDISRYNT